MYKSVALVMVAFATTLSWASVQRPKGCYEGTVSVFKNQDASPEAVTFRILFPANPHEDVGFMIDDAKSNYLAGAFCSESGDHLVCQILDDGGSFQVSQSATKGAEVRFNGRLSVAFEADQDAYVSVAPGTPVTRTAALRAAVPARCTNLK